ncbi:hypothetical protein LIA77_02394 [Sarocladium implicatum]|nr:hypothetical protein LIA77_02394 [Sarocladium implicatum]
MPGTFGPAARRMTCPRAQIAPSRQPWLFKKMMRSGSAAQPPRRPLLLLLHQQEYGDSQCVKLVVGRNQAHTTPRRSFQALLKIGGDTTGSWRVPHDPDPHPWDLKRFDPRFVTKRNPLTRSLPRLITL